MVTYRAALVEHEENTIAAGVSSRRNLDNLRAEFIQTHGQRLCILKLSRCFCLGNKRSARAHQSKMSDELVLQNPPPANAAFGIQRQKDSLQLSLLLEQRLQHHGSLIVRWLSQFVRGHDPRPHL